MTTYVEITDTAKVRSNTNLVIQGIPANQGEWSKHSFYPNVGVVGELIGDGMVFEGKIYIVSCGEGLIVPVLPAGIKTISYSDFQKRYPNNKVVGKASASSNSRFNVDELLDSMGWFY